MDNEKEVLTTNRIEEVLLKKSTGEFCKAFNKACNDFQIAIRKIGIDLRKSQDRDAWVKWFNETINFHPYAYGFDISFNSASPEQLPDGIKEDLLKKAVNEFLRSVKNTKSVVDEFLYDRTGG